MEDLLGKLLEAVELGKVDIKSPFPPQLRGLDGAPVNNDFCQKIGADFYAPGPQGAVEHLSRLAS